ncbi:FtsW/RodA/SpoVE family cell cycle protein [Gracilimonas mengyeensis]|uniref:Probable peptidoglycan glycosyltransferase FtsW n=1 Tax=Gracilimonas mengyeensis TaxID=1302730 RepID=A0A521E165_9BACT|nr:putative peptidoglycan glycosyltransferase FtsW [Gracilimonas mengyeensis]SMO77709.1 cell division protein FtsW [Gracilimonas mengyeensis]
MIYTSPHSNISNVMGSQAEDIDNRAQGSDRYLLMAVVILMTFGILAVYSSIAFFAESKATTAGQLIIGHLVKLGIAFFVMLIFSKINYHTIAKFSRLGMVASLFLLLAVLAFGTEQFGAKRWLNVAGFSFQPSMVASVALLVHICVLLSEKQEYIKDFKKSFLPIMFWVVVTCALIGLEDFSSAGILMAICLIVMFVGRISMVQLGTLVAIGIIGGAALIGQSGNRQDRIQQYITQVKDIPSEHIIQGSGYQAQQAHIAIARGELIGVGIGKSSQRDFLPAPYNDFIFAIIAEEYGLLGAASLIFIFTLILIRGVVFIARNAEDQLGALLAVGCTLTIVFYGFVNAGVASGLLPVTGLPMPFVSYGGTSMLFTGLMVGILLNISKHNRGRRTMYYG